MSIFHLPKGRYNAPPDMRYSAYIKNRSNDGKDHAATETHNKNLPDVHGSYGSLVLHPKWKARRKEIITRDQHKCVICGSGTEIQVHHRQYHFIKAIKKFKAPWDYADHLLITLCSKCHARGHSKFKVPSIQI
jgi:5-methylcytosine-specific restriction endonuclease McrA